MNVLVYPSSEVLKNALVRPALKADNLEGLIAEIFSEVANRKDQALADFTARFDGVVVPSLQVTETEFEEAEQQLAFELKEAILLAARNIEQFHRSQENRELPVETSPGVSCWRRSVPIQTVGLYVPGGTAPLFSTVLMLGIPAKIAGNPNRYLCTPPNREGKIHPAILVAARTAGINTVFKVGGVQAIAAMSCGTESIPKADKIFGPGNQYVTASKRYAQQLGVAMDLPAGPSEVLVAADRSVPVSFVAADLLAQAEHGTDSQVVFLTDDVSYAAEVCREVELQVESLPRAAICKEALKSSTVIVENAKSWPQIINEYAPEHLIVMGNYEEAVTDQVVHAGSVFIGRNTAESFGDYASGTNHTLPTSGFARAYSGVSLDSFVKKITYQRVSDSGLRNLGQTVITMAEAEALQGHANAIKVRLAAAKNTSCEPEYASIERFIRPDLRSLQPYSSARDEFDGNGAIFLDANENNWVGGYNRYPDPQQKALKRIIGQLKGIAPENLLLGNGSDEVLDLIIRLTTVPYRDSVAFLDPGYGMYGVLAGINGVKPIPIGLDEQFRIPVNELLAGAAGSRLLIICNPNNPTGAVIPNDDLLTIVREFQGVVVVDEAYIDFCPEYSVADQVLTYPNLIVVQTLSKAYGMAGLRIGMAIASPSWVQALNRIKAPYNLSAPAQEIALHKLTSMNWNSLTQELIRERERVFRYLQSDPEVSEVFPSHTNFILFRIPQASKVYQELLEEGIVVRDRSRQYRCSDTLRVSIGTREENDRLIERMKKR